MFFLELLLRPGCATLRRPYLQLWMLIHYLLAFLLLGCHEKSNSLEQLKVVNEVISQVQKPIDFQTIGSDKWSRVCFFGPYATESSDVLGFDWDVTQKIENHGNEGVNTIVFTTQTQVTEFVVMPRNKVDFWKLSRQCFARANAKFIYDGSSYIHTNTAQALTENHNGASSKAY